MRQPHKQLFGIKSLQMYHKHLPVSIADSLCALSALDVLPQWEQERRSSL